MKDASQFDEYAEDYDSVLSRGLSVSGENTHYFARGRVAWLSKQVNALGEQPKSVMDFGCGTGSATPYLLELLGVDTVIGVEVSSKSIDVAKRTYGSDRARFMAFEEYQPDEQLDVVFCNGVFHHMPLDKRAESVEYIHRALRPGGLFALWENNPWNPATRYVMSRCPFDKDAMTLTPPEARRLARAGDFTILHTDFHFIFPRMLSWFRGIEPLVSRLPFGTQYQVLCRKPVLR
jgi:SAM-dependent methyltransferase